MPVVDRAHRRHEPDAPCSPVGERRADVRHGPGDDHARLLAVSAVSVASASYASSSSGRLGRDRHAMTLDRRPVAALDRAGELEVVLDHAPHEWLERLLGHVRRSEQPAGGATERHEVVRRHRGARVVERAMLVGEDERSQPERLGELDRHASAPRGDSPVTAAQAPSSCSGPRSCVKVCSGCSENRRRCGSSEASGLPPLTCATHGPGASSDATSAIARSGTQSRTSSASCSRDGDLALGETRARRHDPRGRAHR